MSSAALSTTLFKIVVFFCKHLAHEECQKKKLNKRPTPSYHDVKKEFRNTPMTGFINKVYC